MSERVGVCCAANEKKDLTLFYVYVYTFFFLLCCAEVKSLCRANGALFFIRKWICVVLEIHFSRGTLVMASHFVYICGYKVSHTIT